MSKKRHQEKGRKGEKAGRREVTNPVPLRLEESEDHPPADDELVHLVDQRLNHRDLSRDLIQPGREEGRKRWKDG